MESYPDIHVLENILKATMVEYILNKHMNNEKL